MGRRRYQSKTDCPIEAALAVIGGLWKPLILFALLDGKLRFGELSRIVSGATQRMLTLQLRELEADGIITRTVYAEVPPRVDYQLTDAGRSLEPLLRSLHEWGFEHLNRRTSEADE